MTSRIDEGTKSKASDCGGGGLFEELSGGGGLFEESRARLVIAVLVKGKVEGVGGDVEIALGEGILVGIAELVGKGR